MILYVTSGRADWGKLQPIIARTAAVDPKTKQVILSFGAHHLTSQGMTFGKVVVGAGDAAQIVVERSHVPGFPAGDFARAAEATARTIRTFRPNAVVVHGDRLEAAAAATAAWAEQVAIVQVEAGEINGCRDNGWSRMISSVAHLLIACNEEAANEARKRAAPWANIATSGCPGYDLILGVAKEEIPKQDQAIIILHPDDNDTGGDIARLCAAVMRAGLMLEERGIEVSGWWPNHDAGSGMLVGCIRDLMRQLVPRRWRKDMHRRSFLRLLAQARVIIGNSSVGIREASPLRTWAIDVGTRQAGRVPHEANVFRIESPTPGHIFELTADLIRREPPAPSWPFGAADGRNTTRAAAIIGAWRLDQVKK